MPYICLVRNDIPDGSVYIKSLRSESQRIPSIDPVGQARYVNRVQSDWLYASAGGVITQDAYGLGAYFADRLEPGGTEASTGTITPNGPLSLDTITIGGVIFTAFESLASGTFVMAGPQDGDTVTIKGITFTAKENYATGNAIIGAGCTAGDTFAITVGATTYTFTAVHGVPGDITHFSDAQAPSTAILSATSLVTQIMATAGLAAVLTADNVGGTSATVTMTASARGLSGQYAMVQTGGHITPSGITMVAALPDVTNCQFAGLLQAVGGTNAAVATSLAAAVSNTTPVNGGQTKILAAAPAGVGCTATNVGGTSATLTVTATAAGVQGQFASAESTANVRIHKSGATMGLTAPNPALGQYATLLEAGTNALVATSLQSAINNAASQTLFAAANNGATVTSGAPVVATITLTPSVVGQSGAFSLTTSAPARVTLSGTHMTRTMETWTMLKLNSLVAPIIARMDAGLSLTATAINALINGVAGVSNTSISSPGSTTTLADILSILAGRGYYIPAGAAKLTNAWTWNTTPAGGFGKPYVKVDTRMLGGELRPLAIGGDAATHEFRPIRHTYLTDELIESLEEGELAVFIAKAGMPALTLWPTHSMTPQLTWEYQKAILNPVAEVDNAQIIMIYNDDGSILT